MKKVVHFSFLHPRYDTRVFYKELTSLQKVGYDCYWVVADGLGNEIKNGIKIIDAGKRLRGAKNMIKSINRTYKKALEIDGDIYHFHDPELMFKALKLKRSGKKVIYDIHEDYSEQIKQREFMPKNKIFKNFISFMFRIFENYMAKKMDYLITVVPFLTNKFKKINKKTIELQNYVLLEEFYYNYIYTPFKEKKNHLCYIGGITKIRGCKEIIQSLEYLEDNIKLELGGPFFNQKFKKELKKLKRWDTSVNYNKWLNRKDMNLLFSKTKIGIINFLPFKNHYQSSPNKLFEYMSAGLPIIGSNFPNFKKIIEGNNCGICVDPTNPKVIANAVQYLLDNPEEAEKMGENGRKIVKEKYNWEIEEKKLLYIYKSLC